MNTRVILSIFLSALMLLIISSNDSSAVKPRRLPSRAPAKIEHDLGKLNLGDFKAKDISVTFWSSHDAASRLENIKLAAQAKDDPEKQHIGVNIDDEPDLYRAYLLRDKLHNDTLQLRVDSNIAKDLAAAYGYGTFYY